MSDNKYVFDRTEKEAATRLMSSKSEVKKHVATLRASWLESQADQAVALTDKTTYRKYIKNILKSSNGNDADKRLLCDVAATLAAIVGRADLRKVAVGLRDNYSLV